MKYLLLILLLLTSCASYPKQYIGIIHDYVFENGKDLCKNNDGLQYIVAIETLNKEKSDNSSFIDYPCTSVYKIRCQNQKLFELNSGINWCFISQDQLKETLK